MRDPDAERARLMGRGQERGIEGANELNSHSNRFVEKGNAMNGIEKNLGKQKSAGPASAGADGSEGKDHDVEKETPSLRGRRCPSTGTGRRG